MTYQTNDIVGTLVYHGQPQQRFTMGEMLLSYGEHHLDASIPGLNFTPWEIFLSFDANDYQVCCGSSQSCVSGYLIPGGFHLDATVKSDSATVKYLLLAERS